MSLNTVSARWVFPIAADPIANGRVETTGSGRIADVSSLHEPVIFPTAALLPRLVNLHTHLELSDAPAPIAAKLALPEWAPKIVQYRSNRDGDGTDQGLEESSAAAIAACIDITQPDAPNVDTDASQECRRIPHLECIGLSEQRSAEVFAAAKAYLACTPSAGLSPHAPYSVAPGLLRKLINLANDQRRSITMHVAESPAERELLQEGTGPFRTMLENFGVWDARLFGRRSVSSIIDELARADRCIIAHGNDLKPDEYSRLAGKPDTSIAYCPRTHAYFGYERHPVREMLAAGVNVGLGTDSRASTPDLSLWNEVLFLRKTRPDIAPDILLKLATQFPATAVGLASEFGTIEPGRDGNLLVVPLAKPNATDPYEALFG